MTTLRNLERWTVEPDDRPEGPHDDLRCERCGLLLKVGKTAYVERDGYDCLLHVWCSAACARPGQICTGELHPRERPCLWITCRTPDCGTVIACDYGGNPRHPWNFDSCCRHHGGTYRDCPDRPDAFSAPS